MKIKRVLTYNLYVCLVLTIGLMLQGCCKESHPNTPEEPVAKQQPIGMAVSSVEGTRALFEEASDLSEFVVYGYRQGTISDMVFTDQLVSRSGNIWSYTPTKYWDRTANYSFGAYAPTTLPASMRVENNIAGNQILTFTLPQWQLLDNTETDLIVATSQGTANNYISMGGEVDFAFSHVYAQLSVVVLRNAFLVNEYRLKTLAYKDMPISESTTYTLNYTDGTSVMNTKMVEASDSVMMRLDDGSKGALIKEVATDGTLFKYLVVPSSTKQPGGFRITLRYTIGDVERYAVVSSGISELEAGKSYVLRLSFDSGANIVPKVTMQEWVDEEIPDDDDMYNW